MKKAILKFLEKSTILLIKTYQLTRAWRLPCCRFYPSCSNYSLEAIEKHGIAQGLTLGIRRLLKCHPWHAGGVDLIEL